MNPRITDEQVIKYTRETFCNWQHMCDIGFAEGIQGLANAFNELKTELQKRGYSVRQVGDLLEIIDMRPTNPILRPKESIELTTIELYANKMKDTYAWSLLDESGTRDGKNEVLALLNEAMIESFNTGWKAAVERRRYYVPGDFD